MRVFQADSFAMSAPPAPKKRRSDVSRMQDESIVCEEDVDSPFTLYFLQLPDADVTEEEVKNLKACFKAAKEQGVCPKWVQAEEVERLQSSDDFFVVPCFRGKLFRKIQARHLRVYGPPIVFECLEKPKALPHWNHAIFSSVFEGAKISFTCIAPEKRRELIEKVCWMSGVIGETLYHESTHLVCGKAEQTEKYKAAVQNSIKLMKMEWVDELWDISQKTMGCFSGVIPDAVNQYELGVFEGMEMALTSIDGADRTNLMQLVEAHGGKVPGNMTKSRCTHLITDQTNSQKYKKAVDWKIHIVQTRWVRKCIDLGHLVDETKYHPKNLSVEHLRSSTPKRDANLTETGPDVSSIAGHGGRLSISSFNTSTAHTQSNSVVFGQRHRSSIPSSSSSVVASSTLKNDDTIQRRRSDQFATPIARTNTVPLIRHSTSQSISTPPAAQDPIDELRKQVDGLDELFENCMVYICGVAEKQKEKWWRFLNQTGATRVAKFESATIVIVVTPSQQEKMTIRKFLSQDDIAIVNVNWVSECVKEKRCVSHEGFEWAESQPEDSQPSGSLSRHPSSISCRTVLTSYSELPPVQAKGIFGTQTYFIHRSIPRNAVAQLEETLKANGGIIEKKAENAEFIVCAHSSPLHELIEYNTVVTDLYVETCINNNQHLKLSDHPLFVPLPRPPIAVFNQKLFYLHSSSQFLRKYVKTIIESSGGVVTDSLSSKSVIVMMERAKLPSQYRTRTVVDLSLIVASMSECKPLSINDHLYKDDTVPLQNYHREDDIWTKCLREKDTTEEIEELEEEERNRVGAMNVEQERENRLSPLENPYFHDHKKAFKMNLKLDGVSQIIDNIPSPSPNTQDSTLTTSRVGSMLRTAVYNTGLQREKPEAIVRPPSSVIAENRRTVSSTPVLQRKQEQQRLVDMDVSEQNQEHVEELNRRYEMHPHFLLSISEMEKEEADRVKEGIEQLGGIIENEFKQEVSILIAVRMGRTPKTLCAIAAGKWCLSPEYVLESVSAGHWLDKKLFEWHPSRLEDSNSKTIGIERSLARVCSEWRLRIASMPITCSVSMETRKNGAFSGWRCVVHMDDKRTRPILSILEAGGAIVSSITEYVEVANHKPTIVIASTAFDWNIQSAAYLKRSGIPLYVYEYIYHFIIKEDGQDLSQHLHPNYKKA